MLQFLAEQAAAFQVATIVMTGNLRPFGHRGNGMASEYCSTCGKVLLYELKDEYIFARDGKVYCADPCNGQEYTNMKSELLAINARLKIQLTNTKARLREAEKQLAAIRARLVMSGMLQPPVVDSFRQGRQSSPSGVDISKKV